MEGLQMSFRILFALAGAFLLAACNPGAQLEDAEKQIKQFQARYNDGDTEALYGLGGDAFREAATPEDLENLVAMLSARLGTIESSERTGFNTAFNNGINTTTVVMTTRFELGEGNETYVFHGAGEDMELVGWNVNSPRLMLTAEEMRALSQKDDKAPAR